MSPIIWILLLPLAGTVVGSAFVFFIKDQLPNGLQKALLGFAAGVMVAASVWSLLIPGMEMSTYRGAAKVLPAGVGFLLGMGFLLLIDSLTPHLHAGTSQPEGLKAKLSQRAMLALAVTIHNFPEGMAVGVVIAGALQADPLLTSGAALLPAGAALIPAGAALASTGTALASTGASLLPAGAALAVALGIAIQNVPEGAIVSIPLRADGGGKWRSFAIGALTGIVEPLGALAVLALAPVLTPVLPYFLGFAAGAMLYVVVEELIPEAGAAPHSNLSTIGFALGFVLMMVLDVVLG